jgi:hypothetical protein
MAPANDNDARRRFCRAVRAKKPPSIANLFDMLLILELI